MGGGSCRGRTISGWLSPEWLSPELEVTAGLVAGWSSTNNVPRPASAPQTSTARGGYGGYGGYGGNGGNGGNGGLGVWLLFGCNTCLLVCGGLPAFSHVCGCLLTSREQPISPTPLPYTQRYDMHDLAPTHRDVVERMRKLLPADYAAGCKALLTRRHPAA